MFSAARSAVTHCLATRRSLAYGYLHVKPHRFSSVSPRSQQLERPPPAVFLFPPGAARIHSVERLTFTFAPLWSLCVPFMTYAIATLRLSVPQNVSQGYFISA
jgi:hypothetical protein